MTTITCLVIPADPQQPLLTKELPTADYDAYAEIVGGSYQVVDLDRPKASMYVNLNGKEDGLPFNPRATAILWAHNSAFRGAEIVAGDILVVGPVGPGGEDLAVPEELADLLLAPGPFKIEVQVDNDDGWHGNDTRFRDVHVAYAAGADLAHRWTLVREVRVVKDYSALIEQWLEIGRRSPEIRNAGDPPFNRDSFVHCSTLEELQVRIGSTDRSSGRAFYYRDLCLINQVEGGDEWLAIRSFTDEHGTTCSIAFETFTFGPFIERGEFTGIIRGLLSASQELCQRLQ